MPEPSTWEASHVCASCHWSGEPPVRVAVLLRGGAANMGGVRPRRLGAVKRADHSVFLRLCLLKKRIPSAAGQRKPTHTFSVQQRLQGVQTRKNRVNDFGKIAVLLIQSKHLGAFQHLCAVASVVVPCKLYMITAPQQKALIQTSLLQRRDIGLAKSFGVRIAAVKRQRAHTTAL